MTIYSKLYAAPKIFQNLEIALGECNLYKISLKNLLTLYNKV